ncbi:hypothetical protein Glove_420g98 [Diversispora epigaea]|uniref:Uncharacterized protein n=1 Tax=Diversispora epigaea TaxID=1348612 RepID=A0A397H066_9GLOM|nr:hypothetical protein Glove_420g98 [Diversispora epigaea]
MYSQGISDIEYVEINELDYDFMIKEREKHDAYNSHPILRHLRTNFNISNNSNTIQSNTASHMVSYFSNNDKNELQFVSQRENQWKISYKSMTKTLANYNYEKSHQLYRIRNLIPQIPNIENTNINDDFPLMQNHFVFCFYNKNICVGQVLVIYYELYGNHSFNIKQVTKIDNISKITLKVFLPINNNLFTQCTPEECYIFTYRNPSNIIFHISCDNVTINDQFLFLSNEAKNYYNYFKRNDVISLILKNSH